MHYRRDRVRPPFASLLVRLLLLGLAAVALSGLAPVPARGQVRIPAEATAEDAGLQQALQQGLTLEQQRRWGEALAHYENAVQGLPGPPGPVEPHGRCPAAL